MLLMTQRLSYMMVEIGILDLLAGLSSVWADTSIQDEENEALVFSFVIKNTIKSLSITHWYEIRGGVTRGNSFDAIDRRHCEVDHIADISSLLQASSVTAGVSGTDLAPAENNGGREGGGGRGGEEERS